MKIALLTAICFVLSIPAFAATTPDHVLVYQDGDTVYVDINNGDVARQIYNQLPIKGFDNGAVVIKDAGNVSCYMDKKTQVCTCSINSDLDTK